MIEPVLVTLARTMALLVLAGALARLLHRSSAAARHLVWSAALSGALLVPLAVFMGPSVAWPVLPASIASGPQPDRAAVDEAPGLASPSAPSAAPFPDSPSSEQSPQPAGVGPARILLWIWAAGGLLVLLHLGVGTVRLAWIARHAQPAPARRWHRLGERLAAAMGLRRRVLFVEGAAHAMPMTWGLFTPRVLLPACAERWPHARQRIVLLHELAHVKRRDCLTQFVAQLACAVHWFNPLVWHAARQLRAERERACDDLVLASGTAGTDYADHLLEIARSMRTAMLPTWAAVAMAHRSQLEGRLMAILDPRVPRRLATRRSALLVIALLVLALPVVLVTPVPKAAEATPWIESPARQPGAPAATPLPTPRPRPRPDGDARTQTSPVVEAVTDAVPDALNDLRAEGWIDRVPADALRAIGEGIGQAVSLAVAGSVQEAVAPDTKSTGTSGARRDPRAVAALVGALQDADAEVREHAMVALARMRAPEALDAIRAALKDALAPIREQAAVALGQYRDKSSVDPLTAALKDPSADVREQAAFALGQIRDPRAAGALTAALKDENASVREQAAFALGQLRSREAVPALIEALRDPSASVREQAAFALGQIGDERAIDALTAALKDTNAEVRRHAAFALGRVGSN